MQKLLFMAFLMVSVQCKAQLIRQYQDVDDDSTDFEIVFGSINEYNLEMGLKMSGRNILLYNAKAYYVSWLADQIAVAEHTRSVEVDYGDNWDTYTIGVSGIDIKKGDDVVVKTLYDTKTLRNKKITITGRPDDIANIFILYWDSDISINELKTRKQLVRYAGNDKVAFSWTGARPVITITKGNVEILPFRPVKSDTLVKAK